jgi:hypothetical protein
MQILYFYWGKKFPKLLQGYDFLLRESNAVSGCIHKEVLLMGGDCGKLTWHGKGLSKGGCQVLHGKQSIISQGYPIHSPAQAGLISLHFPHNPQQG